MTRFNRLQLDFASRMKRPILAEAMEEMKQTYGELPPPSKSDWLGYLIKLGAARVLEEYGPNSPNEQVSMDPSPDGPLC